MALVAPDAPKTWRVLLDHPDFITWAHDHDLEPGLMNGLVTFSSDGTCVLQRVAFDADGEFHMDPGASTHITLPVRIDLVRPIPAHVLKDPSPEFRRTRP